MKGWVTTAIILGLLHWGSVAAAAWATPSCNKKIGRSNAARCACIKDGYWKSALTERLWLTSIFDSLKDSDFHDGVRRGLGNLYRRCY